MKIISFINMKGGVGKTTSVVEVATILVKDHAKRVLIIDIDPQTNATFSFVKYDEWQNKVEANTIADVLGMNKHLSSRDSIYDINKAVIKNVSGIQGLDLISSHLSLTFLDLDLSGKAGREFILSRQIECLNGNYDYILIDCPPNLTLAPQNALVASDYIVTPIIPDFYSFLGLPLLKNRVDRLRQDLNTDVSFLGCLFTRVESNANLHSEFMPKIRTICQRSGIYDFKTIVPKNIKLSEASSSSSPARIMFPSEPGVIAYKTVVNEMLKRLGDI
ncbi:ParA family protein [Vibrio cholerae]|uniref:ParA family protein n=1 Tax=Vibrio cholerae TaxID=666 RepID=UPI0020872362|nr:ParA family protein [Vibrio cholerae]EKG0039293.1 ParA family protein [Vibrio cholerae]ELH5152310.1 ParA family protein [Vibrio cholerae]MCR9870383.1 ParA family protein [Vibrio cholerae]GIA21415.1 chromosome partitioning protein ParA protein [Vibrio cholerae]